MISVVIIDDNKPTTDRISKTVPWEKLGCEVVAIRYDGVSGKKAILQHLPDLIITDIKMPGLDGLEVVELTRGMLPRSRVIFISAYDHFDYAYQAIKLKAFDYLIKPFSQADLLHAVERAAADIKATQAPAPAPAAAPEKSLAERAAGYVEAHIADPITLEYVSSLFGVSASHLGRLIRQHTGKRFVDFVTAARIAKAKRLLDGTDYHVGEIAEMVGYKNYLTFYKVFSKLEGVAPTEYQKRPRVRPSEDNAP